MSIRTVTKVIVSCDKCHKDLINGETESAALFATPQSAREVVADLAGELWGPWLLEQDGSATCPECRSKCTECGEFTDTADGRCDNPYDLHETTDDSRS